ncbi:hypothetical protein ACFQX7_20465 [Luedemannella flava]
MADADSSDQPRPATPGNVPDADATRRWTQDELRAAATGRGPSSAADGPPESGPIPPEPTPPVEDAQATTIMRPDDSAPAAEPDEPGDAESSAAVAASEGPAEPEAAAEPKSPAQPLLPAGGMRNPRSPRHPPSPRRPPR